MSKSKAFLTHFMISLTVVSAVLAVMLLLWYPQPYFVAFEAMDIVKVLVGVDLVLGPALTLVVYKPGKKSLWFDMSCVAALQLGALVYGTSVIYEQRPYYVVFAADRFEILARSDIDETELRFAELREKPWGQPILAAAMVPDDPAARQRLLQETVFEGKPDIERRPALWEPYSPEFLAGRAIPLPELAERRPAAAAEVRAVTNRHQGPLSYAPVMGKTRAYALVLAPESLRPVDIVDADPFTGTR